VFFNASLPTLLLGIAGLAALAFVHGLIAWPIARRYGTWVFAVSSVLATLLIFGSCALVAASGMRASGMPVESAMVVGLWPVVIPLLVAFGFSSSSLRKSMLRIDASRPSPNAIARAVGAFFAGFGILLLGVLLLARVGALTS